MRWLAAPLHPLEIVALIAFVALTARRLYRQLPPSELPWLHQRLRQFTAACRSRLVFDAALGSFLTTLLLALACWLLPGPWRELPLVLDGLAGLQARPLLAVRALLYAVCLFWLWTWGAAVFSRRHSWLRVVAGLREKGRRADLSPEAKRWCEELSACTRIDILLGLYNDAGQRATAWEAWQRWASDRAAGGNPVDLFWMGVLKLARREDPQLDAKSEAYQRIRARFAADAGRLSNACQQSGRSLLDGRRVAQLKAGSGRLLVAWLLMALCVLAAGAALSAVRPADVEEETSKEVEVGSSQAVAACTLSAPDSDHQPVLCPGPAGLWRQRADDRQRHGLMGTASGAQETAPG